MNLYVGSNVALFCELYIRALCVFKHVYLRCVQYSRMLCCIITCGCSSGLAACLAVGPASRHMQAVAAGDGSHQRHE